MNPLDQHLLNAYLDGELDSAAVEAFELLMIQRPDLAAQVDADSALRFGLGVAGDVHSTGRPSAGAAGSAPAADNVVHLEPRRMRRLLPLSAAASVVLGLGFVAGKLGSESPGQTTLEPATLAYIDKTRALSRVPEVRLPRSGALVLLVPVAAVESCTAKVRLTQSGTRTLEAEALPDEFGYVSLLVPPDHLQPGEARVEIGCIGRAPANYELTVVANAAKADSEN